MAAPSRRRSPLPRNWASLRARTFARDGHMCVMCGSTERLECDHIGAHDEHSIDNLQTLCRRCHSRKTSRDANRAKPSRTRPVPKRHPGQS